MEQGDSWEADIRLFKIFIDFYGAGEQSSRSQHLAT
jgi:hypothetical protein